MTAAAAQTTRAKTRAMSLSSDQDAQSPMLDQAGASQRHAIVAEAAFFIVQSRGLLPDRQLDDWLAAEHEVDQRLAGAAR
jgi:hypothetical protein